MSELTPRYRKVVQAAEGTPASDGAGVKLTRVIGSPSLGIVDPFLMLDEFRSDDPDDYIAGFPEHPHRGFETVTYMLAGKVRHEDNRGHKGVIDAGGVQWMTAGRGIVHSEMPEQEEGLMWGFQLWINLPAAQKMTDPAYQEFDGAAVPEEHRDDGVKVRIIAGATGQGTKGLVAEKQTAPTYFDVSIPAGGAFEEVIAADANAVIYVYKGSVTVGDDTLARGIAGVLAEGDRVRVEAGEDGAGFLFLAGRPLEEPVAWGGPFVMNTREEVMQAYDDFNAGRF